MWKLEGATQINLIKCIGNKDGLIEEQSFVFFFVNS